MENESLRITDSASCPIRLQLRKLWEFLTDFIAKTYHDGKWLLLTVDSEQILKDIEVLLEVKRKIKI
ncbi:MAG: DUF3788 family protein [Endomicrobiaceae bacterium]